MPIPGKPEIKVNLDYTPTSIDKHPLGAAEPKPIKLTQAGKLVDPTEVSIESNPLTDLEQ